MRRTKEAVMILACDRHTDAIVEILDRLEVRNWVIIPAAQARRLGFLEYRPPDENRGCEVIFGIDEPNRIREILRRLSREAHQGGVCPDCVTFTWDVRESAMSDVVRDPVCEMSVESEGAPHATFEGRDYYFCSEDCRDRFVNNPEAFIKQVA